MTRFNYLIIIITLTAFVFSACAEKEAQPELPELPEGLEIEDLVVGDGETAGESDFITVHYKGMLSNGDIFEDSRDIGQPATFQLGVGMLIDGWDIGLQGMKVGGQRRLVLQPGLAYGEQGAGDVIPPNEELTFEIELLEVRKMPVSWDYDDADIQTMESGLKYVVMEEGAGDKPESGDRIRVNYSGYLEDGELFDSSFIREDSFEFNVGTGAVIQGWDQGLLDMRPGEKRKLIIPASLAYGERGIGNVIPPNATLYFDVELVEVVE